MVNFLENDGGQTSFGKSFEKANKRMEDRQDSEKLIGKLIKKRKEENEAFMKLLNAIESKGNTANEQPKDKPKTKS